MNRNELAKTIYETAYVAGTFKLRSGQMSDHYLDKYLFESDPKLLGAIAKKLKDIVPADTEVLAGIEMGGIPIATALSLETGIPVVFVRKKAKPYATEKLAEGIGIQGKRVCIIEDVVTTGGQIIASAEDLAVLGARLGPVLCVIERSPRNRKALEDAGLALTALFTTDELHSAGTQSDHTEAAALPHADCRSTP
ncbi:orotate phosphoribosyltransferase [Paenibacillus allorhizosphaerae]|uniref:Orotate phosphoribosyltransferase n=1 Tax=Paenibacillus allorhizosphaerae TaxID=2849866 RepID=A0ABM8VFV1_9BACL|nr:orotate phosphoribosyltransferase [Paenibacillus allorhizosphaerae]CAG7635990.1 Orotate phosphoribosyltransferase [Paenibacillus allorhizosphaerae]